MKAKRKGRRGRKKQGEEADDDKKDSDVDDIDDMDDDDDSDSPGGYTGRGRPPLSRTGSKANYTSDNIFDIKFDSSTAPKAQENVDARMDVLNYLLKKPSMGSMKASLFKFNLHL